IDRFAPHQGRPRSRCWRRARWTCDRVGTWCRRRSTTRCGPSWSSAERLDRGMTRRSSRAPMRETKIPSRRRKGKTRLRPRGAPVHDQDHAMFVLPTTAVLTLALIAGGELPPLGSLSEKYESGGRGPGTVSTGKGDLGGVSYGTYQLSSKVGRAD